MRIGDNERSKEKMVGKIKAEEKGWKEMREKGRGGEKLREEKKERT